MAAAFYRVYIPPYFGGKLESEQEIVCETKLPVYPGTAGVFNFESGYGPFRP